MKSVLPFSLALFVLLQCDENVRFYERIEHVLYHLLCLTFRCIWFVLFCIPSLGLLLYILTKCVFTPMMATFCIGSVILCAVCGANMAISCVGISLGFLLAVALVGIDCFIQAFARKVSAVMKRQASISDCVWMRFPRVAGAAHTTSSPAREPLLTRQ